MEYILIKDELQKDILILAEDGKRIQSKLVEILKTTKDTVGLDFSGINLLYTQFLMELLSNLGDNSRLEYRELLKRITFKGLDRDYYQLVYLAVSNTLETK